MSFREVHYQTESDANLGQAGSYLSQVSAETICLNSLQAAIEQKSLDVRGLDIRKLTDIADYFVIASGTSDRHVKGIVDKIKLELRLSYNELPVSIAGYEHGEWVVMDYGNVVIHVFYEPTRQYYLFDELWSRAEVIRLSPELEREAKKLRTGIYR